MMISTRGRYALRVMADLAQQDSSSYIPLKEIAERQDISEKYLESIVKALTQAKYLEGVRGKGGGYRLTRPADGYTLYSVLKLTEGDLAPVSCLEVGGAKCERAAECPTLPVWRELDQMIRTYLESKTIADLLRKEDEGNEYYI